jgi:hypothetical protein
MAPYRWWIRRRAKRRRARALSVLREAYGVDAWVSLNLIEIEIERQTLN